jgi:4-diphosphocytidyl-2-C-methyl-D-erythritol kinase
MKNTHYNVCTIQAPCKINLHLKIGAKRPDGFHNLESIFVPLDFGDTLRFEKGEKGDSHLSGGEKKGDSHQIPREKTLIWRAANLFRAHVRERCGYEPEFKIRVEKRIPLGAGLGGGSSNAASSLLAMNLLSGSVFSTAELMEMAALLGSDVPFFFSGGAAFVSGRGEIIEPLKTPQGLWVILLKPPFSSETASAYRLLDEYRAHAERFQSKTVLNEECTRETVIRAFYEDPATWPFFNDFLPLFLDGDLCSHAAEYQTHLESLKEAGASFAGLSGSGSTCFGIFKSGEIAKKAEKKLSGNGNFVKLTFFLAQRADPVLE